MDQPTLHGGAVILRPWRPGDASAVLAACQDPDIQRWTTVPNPYTLADAETYVSTLAPRVWREQTGALFAVTDLSDRLLGSFGLIRLVRAQRLAEVGYWVAPWARRRGVAATATRVLADWALGDLGMARVELYAHPENIASQAVARRAGFTADGSVARTSKHGTMPRLLFLATEQA